MTGDDRCILATSCGGDKSQIFIGPEGRAYLIRLRFGNRVFSSSSTHTHQICSDKLQPKDDAPSIPQQSRLTVSFASGERILRRLLIFSFRLTGRFKSVEWPLRSNVSHLSSSYIHSMTIIFIASYCIYFFSQGAYHWYEEYLQDHEVDEDGFCC